jgi:hypothetical protein
MARLHSATQNTTAWARRRHPVPLASRKSVPPSSRRPLIRSGASDLATIFVPPCHDLGHS